MFKTRVSIPRHSQKEYHHVMIWTLLLCQPEDEDSPKKEFATKENGMLKAIFRIRIEHK